MEYERKINYYETDRMGIVHHSNYIRFLEETRCYSLEKIGMPFSKLEENGITIPVLAVFCKYKKHVTFEDKRIIKMITKEYNGVRMTIGYEIREKETGALVATAETKHCFTNRELKPINLKKVSPEFSANFEKMKEEI